MNPGRQPLVGGVGSATTTGGARSCASLQRRRASYVVVLRVFVGHHGVDLVDLWAGVWALERGRAVGGGRRSLTLVVKLRRRTSVELVM